MRKVYRNSMLSYNYNNKIIRSLNKILVTQIKINKIFNRVVKTIEDQKK